MSLRVRAVGLLLVLGAVLAWAALAVEGAIDDVAAQRRLVEAQLLPGQVLALDVLTDAVNQETGARGFVLTGDERFLDPYVAGRQASERHLADLERVFAEDAGTLALVTQVESDLDAWDARSRREVAAAASGDAALARQLVVRGEGKEAFDRLRQSVADLRDTIAGDLVRQQAAADEAFDRLRQTFWVSAAALVALVLLSSLLLRRWVLVPVDRLRSSMRTVAQGELEQPVTASGPSEVEAIGVDAEAMRRRIVNELDRARAATEALEQESPAVAGLVRELRATSADAVTGVQVHGEVHPAEGVLAGDWWDAVPLPGGCTAVLVGDVAGHGPAACLVAARFKNRLGVLLRSTDDLLAAVEGAAADLDRGDETFLTCVVAVVDARWRRVRWLNAGHGPALVLRGRGPDAAAELLHPTGPVVGLPGATWEVHETWLGDDDVVLLMTDGITEARDADGTELDLDGVVRVARQMTTHEPRAVVGEVVEAARRFAVDARRDDLTCVALRLDADGLSA